MVGFQIPTVFEPSTVFHLLILFQIQERVQEVSERGAEQDGGRTQKVSQ